MVESHCGPTQTFGLSGWRVNLLSDEKTTYAEYRHEDVMPRIADIASSLLLSPYRELPQEVTMISIGGKDYDEQELARQIELEILVLDAQIKGLEDWRESRVELLNWLEAEPDREVNDDPRIAPDNLDGST